MTAGRFVLVIALLLFCIFGAEIAQHLTGFAPEESHTAFPFAKPGFRDVPDWRQSFDGDKRLYDVLCSISKGAPIALDGSNGVMHALSSARRALSLIMAEAWYPLKSEARVQRHAVERALSDWPMWREELLRACDQEGCPLAMLIESSRFLRLTRASFERMDVDDDGFVVRAEFLGAPVTRPHLLGTDGLGRDCFVRLLEALRLSVAIGFASATVAATFGLMYGAFAGMVGGKVATILLRVVDIIYGLPFFFVVILFITLVGPSLLVLILAIVSIQWLGMARTTYHVVSSLKKAPFVTAARNMGVGPIRIFLTHIMPNARRPILTLSTLLVPGAIKEEAFLSFLGLGVQPPRASLGTLIGEGVQAIAEAPWLVAGSGIALFGLVLVIHVVADILAQKD